MASIFVTPLGGLVSSDKIQNAHKYNVTCTIRAVHVNNQDTYLLIAHDIILKLKGMAQHPTLWLICWVVIYNLQLLAAI